MKRLYSYKQRSAERKNWALGRLSGVAGLGIYALVWIALWSSINSGPWVIVAEKAGMLDWLNATRASMPLVVLLLWFVLLPARTGRGRAVTGAEVLWILYAVAMLVSTRQTDSWFVYGYWAIAYLGVFAAIDITLRASSVSRAIDMVRFNWLLGTLFLVAMLFLARDVLLVESELGLTAYNLDQRAEGVAGAPISKTSGLSRLAIVPAVVGFVLMLQLTGAARTLWAAVFLGAALMVWFFQTRQGIFGMAFALGFVMLLHGGRTRVAGAVFTLLIGLLLFAGALPQDAIDYVTEYALRGEGMEAFESMTGRDELWRMGWRFVEESPWSGYGPQADRRLIYQNASNGPLYAAMCAGYPGLLLYLGGLVWGWILFARAFLDRLAWSAEERVFLVQVGGIMAYLTLRNIPENAASFYSVDLLLHATMIAFLGTLEREHQRRRMITTLLRTALVGATKGRLAPAGARKSRPRSSRQ